MPAALFSGSRPLPSRVDGPKVAAVAGLGVVTDQDRLARRDAVGDPLASVPLSLGSVPSGRPSRPGPRPDRASGWPGRSRIRPSAIGRVDGDLDVESGRAQRRRGGVDAVQVGDPITGVGDAPPPEAPEPLPVDTGANRGEHGDHSRPGRQAPVGSCRSPRLACSGMDTVLDSSARIAGGPSYSSPAVLVGRATRSASQRSPPWRAG
jgi:hypothetical protein